MRLNDKSASPQNYLPLTPAVFDILLALWGGENHGYAIMQAVQQASEGRTVLRPGTLYRALSRLLETQLVEELEERPDPEWDDERRRYYRLTALGKCVLKAEAARLEQQVETARAKKLLRDPQRV